MTIEYKVGIYARLSKDDQRTEESLSIENQKSILKKYVSEQPGWTLHEIYIDDGWSGSHFERPSLQRMLSDAKNGAINLIIVKDLSRFGRNYIEVGKYTETVLPLIGCRFVALNDDIDTIYNDNDLMPLRSLMNEQLSRDTSRKVRAVRNANAKMGKFIGTYAPYGYQKDAADKHRLVIDEKTAPIVRRVFEMRRSGMGYHSIALVMNDEQIPPPRKSWYEDKNQTSSALCTDLWSDSVIMRLLSNEAYLGHMVQGKQGRFSFRDRSTKSKPKDEWIKVEHTHEPMISQDLWDEVQALRTKKHKLGRPMRGEPNMFTGLVKCADCGYSMRYHVRKYTQKDGDERRSGTFICGFYARSGKGACSIHTIQEKALYDGVLSHIKTNADFIATEGEQRVEESLIRIKDLETAESLALYKKGLESFNARIEETDAIIQKAYEDKVNGVIDEITFSTLIKSFMAERDEKTQEMELLKQKIHAIDCSHGEIAAWVKLVQKYSGIQELNRAVLLEILDHIEVEETIGRRDQCKIQVHYRHIGYVDTAALGMMLEG